MEPAWRLQGRDGLLSPMNEPHATGRPSPGANPHQRTTPRTKTAPGALPHDALLALARLLGRQVAFEAMRQRPPELTAVDQESAP
jgi:hypothetical protein